MRVTDDHGRSKPARPHLSPHPQLGSLLNIALMGTAVRGSFSAIESEPDTSNRTRPDPPFSRQRIGRALERATAARSQPMHNQTLRTLPYAWELARQQPHHIRVSPATL